MRSLLFTPANAARKIEKALASGADAVILDLEDSIPAGEKANARAGAREALAAAQAGGARIIVRVNGLASGEIDADLDALAPLAPAAIMLPKSGGGEDVQHLSIKLAVREAQWGLADGSIGILPIATESAGAVLRLSSYKGASARLSALAWSAEDLTADLGAVANRLPGENGRRRSRWRATSRCSPPAPRAFPRSTPCSPISATRNRCGANARRRGATAFPASSRSIPIRSRSSTRCSRPRTMNWRARGGSSRPSRRLQAQARWRSMAR